MKSETIPDLRIYERRCGRVLSGSAGFWRGINLLIIAMISPLLRGPFYGRRCRGSKKDITSPQKGDGNICFKILSAFLVGVALIPV
jgi:hypothetical protein